MAESDVLFTSEVYAAFTFIVCDHLQDKDLTIQDGKIRRFHAMKTEWGFSKLLSLSTFNDFSNGLLVDECCVFGVDVFVMKCGENGEVFSFVKEPKNYMYTWNINNISKADVTLFQSDCFTVEGYEWKIQIDQGSEKDEDSMSLYLLLVSDGVSELLAESKVYIESEMVIKNQVTPSLHRKIACNGWLDSDNDDTRGWIGKYIMSVGELMKPSNGFILNDSVIVTAKINVISTLKKLSEEGNAAAAVSEYSS